MNSTNASLFRSQKYACVASILYVLDDMLCVLLQLRGLLYLSVVSKLLPEVCFAPRLCCPLMLTGISLRCVSGNFYSFLDSVSEVGISS